MKKRPWVFVVVLGMLAGVLFWVGCALPANEVPFGIGLLTPEQGQAGVGLQPEFCWDVELGSSSRADSFFRLYVAREGEEFAQSVQTQQTRCTWNQKLLAGTSYHWKVEGWFDGKKVGESQERTFCTQEFYTVEVAVGNAQGGQVRAEGGDWSQSIVVQAGVHTPTRLWAQPDANFQLEGWYLGQELLGTGNPFDYLPVAPANSPRDGQVDIQLDVRFSRIACSITAHASPVEHGSVRVNEGDWGESGDATVEAGEEVSLEALAQQDYHFAGWYEELAMGVRGTKVSEDNPYAFEAQDDRTLFAAFERDAYTVTVEAFPAQMGNVRINNGPWGRVQQQQLPLGNPVEVHALGLSGHHFTGWYEGGELLGNDNPYSFTLQGDRTLEGRFEPDPPLVLVRGGSFEMGDEIGDLPDWCSPTHTVVLTYDFWVGETEVTFTQYDAYCASTGAPLPHDGPENPNIHWGRGSRPVINVTWWDAIAYCNWKSTQEGLPVAYRLQGEAQPGSLLDASGKVTTDITQVKGYRLLTEAEWEYAARGGRFGGAYLYAGSDDPDQVSWYYDNSDTGAGRRTQPVGEKQPNALGLYDMSGNVWELCHDWWEDTWYQNGDQTNPIGPGAGDYRIRRGGSWLFVEAGSRVAHRLSYTPGEAHKTLGFRIARTE